MKHYISHAYAREIHHAATLLLIQRRIAQADVLIDQLDNRDGPIGKLRERSRLLAREADRLFEVLAGTNGVLDDSVMRMAKEYRAAERKAEAKRRNAKAANRVRAK